jgi:calcineurin-like phosphoesterase family protein
MKIVLQHNQQLFITSDTHYAHKNIVSGASEWDAGRGCRKFDTIEQMNDTIVNAINRKVGENDILLHLGDWSFGGFDKIKEFRDRINCKTVHLILGNHDHHIERDKDSIRELFASVGNLRYITVVRPNVEKQKHDKYRFIVCHYPIASWQDMSQGVMHLHGHIHTPSEHNLGPGRMLDVGVDGAYNYSPYSLDQVLRLLKNQPIQSLMQHKYDHHE